MKHFFICTLLLLVFSTKAQTISLLSFENILKNKSVDEKTDVLNSNGFVKENSKDKSIRLVKRKFIKRTQSFDEEIFTISGDTISYSLNNPKMYINFKKEVERYYNKAETTSTEKTVFNKKTKTIILKESDEERETGIIKLYNFSLYKTDK